MTRFQQTTISYLTSLESAPPMFLYTQCRLLERLFRKNGLSGYLRGFYDRVSGQMERLQKEKSVSLILSVQSECTI
jgi:hypothetical protein